MRPRPRPVVLALSGIGLTAAVAVRWVAGLSSEHRVIRVSDGDVDAPAEEGSGMEARVSRAIAALDAAGVESAHVVGLSFGGAVAQEIAIRHPERVRSLVLGATSGGGELYVPPEQPVRDFLRGLDELPAEEGLWGSIPYLYAPRTRRRHALRIGEDVARRVTEPLDPADLRAQCTAARTHDAGARLDRITAPTLILHGEEDRMLPAENGRRLASAIAGAHLVTLPHGAHAFPTDVPEAARELVNFVRAQSGPRRGLTRPRDARAGRA
jgi:pimeloyl-ACP methyl ester carboxylesterase